MFVMLFLVLMMLSWATNGWVLEDGRFWPWVAVSLLTAALVAWFPKRWNHIGLRRQIVARMNQMKMEEKTTSYRMEDSQLVIDDEVLGGRLPWTEVYAWRDDDELLLIYRAPQFFYYIDKSEVPPPALTALMDHLKASPGKQL